MKRFETFVEEVKAGIALERLAKIAQGRKLIPCGEIFDRVVLRADLPFKEKDINWPGPPQFSPIHPDVLIAIQRTVDTDHVEHWITTPQRAWYDDEMPVVVRMKGKGFYLWDGHHRTAAAILLEARTITAEMTFV